MTQVLHWVEGATFAGIETHLTALAASLPGFGVKITVASFHEGELAARLSDIGIECVITPRRHKLDFSPVSTVAEMLKKSGAILHTHGYLADIYGSRAAKKSGVRHIATVHGHPEPFPGWRGLKMRAYMNADIKALASVDRVVAVSARLGDSLIERGLPPEKIRVIPNGLPDSSATKENVDAFRSKILGDSAGPLIGFIGRFDPVKAPLRFIEIAFELSQALPDARFAMAGDGPLMSMCRNMATKSPSHDKIHFLGFRRDVDTVIGGCDMIIMPSDSEGVPQVLLAAMRDATTPVCSRVGGIPEVLKAFPECMAEPTTQTLATCAREILESARKKKQLDHDLQGRFQTEYTAELMAKKVAGLYREEKRF